MCDELPVMCMCARMCVRVLVCMRVRPSPRDEHVPMPVTVQCAWTWPGPRRISALACAVLEVYVPAAHSTRPSEVTRSPVFGPSF